MKKILYSLLTLAAALTVASCQQELEGGSVYDDGTTVDATFAVNLSPQTKAFADGTTVDKLYAGIYEMGANDAYTWVADNADAPIAISAGGATVTFNGKITLGKSYKVVFWAQKQDAPYAINWATTATTGPTVTVTATGTGANAESRDAFYGEYLTGKVTGNIVLETPVQLKRPFAQVNVLVPNANVQDGAINSRMTVAQAPTVLNLATKATSAPADWSFVAAAIDETAFGSYKTTHKYVAMNYVLVPQDAAGAQFNVGFYVSAAGGAQLSGDKTVANVPLKPNGRTNIVGNIFDSDFDITVPIIITPGPGTDQVVTEVTVTVGNDVNNPATISGATNIGIDLPYTLETTDDPVVISYDRTDVVVAAWDYNNQCLVVTPKEGVTNGSAVITLVFPAVTKTDYSAATVQIYVKVGSGVNPTPQVAAPTFTPAAGEYTEAQNVTIACATEGASIYYTTDGSDPNTSSTPYTAAIAVNATTTIKAIAVKADMTNSEIATAAYTINTPATPDFTTVAELKALLGAESATFSGTLTNAVVTFIAGTRDAVIKDTSGSILYHKDSGHGLLQGQTVSGDVIVDAVIYNGINEITDLAATVSGEGCAVEPEVVTLAQLAANFAKYENAYVKVVGVTSKTTTTKNGNIEVTQDATDYIVYTNVDIPVNTGDIFTAEGTVTKYNTTEELKVWKTADLTVTAAAPVLSATPAATTVAATVTSVTWTITSNTDWSIVPGTGVTASATSGNGNADVTLSFAANNDTASKTLTATAKATGCKDVTITITQNGTNNSDPTWTRVTNVATLLAGGTFIIGYEDTVNSGIIIPMANSGSATTSAAGFMYSGASASSGGTGTINMASVTETSNFEVQIGESSAVNGAIYIKIGDNYLGNANTKNNCKLFAEDNETTAFTPTVTANGIFSFAIDTNETYKYLKYNSGSPRFCVYSTEPEKIVVYKKD